MKFECRKNIWVLIMLYSAIIIPAFLMVKSAFVKPIDTEFIIVSIILFLSNIFVLWSMFIKYEITESVFKYQSGPFSGSIEINTITSITKNTSMYVGFKPAMDSKGLIIRYNKYDDIYISPKTNESFIAKILEINKDVVIIDKKYKV